MAAGSACGCGRERARENEAVVKDLETLLVSEVLTQIQPSVVKPFRWGQLEKTLKIG